MTGVINIHHIISLIYILLNSLYIVCAIHTFSQGGNSYVIDN